MTCRRSLESREARRVDDCRQTAVADRLAGTWRLAGTRRVAGRWRAIIRRRIALAGRWGVASAVLAACWLAGLTAAGQPREVPWRKANPEIVIDYAKPPAAPTPAFTRDGFGLSIPFGLAVVGQSRVRLKAKVTQPGRFTFEPSSEASQVEVKSVPGGESETAVDLVVSLPLMTEKQAAERAEREAYAAVEMFRGQAERDARDHGGPRIRETLRRFRRDIPEKEPQQRAAYVPVRMCELGKDELLKKVQEFAERHPTWVDRSLADEWPRSEGPALHDYYASLLQLELMESHLRQWGLEQDTTRPRADQLIRSKFAGLVFLVSGGSGTDRDAPKEVRSLGPDDQQRIRSALTVSGRLLFYPRTSEADANSQWYNGQKLQCPAGAIIAVRVHGSLNAAGGDVADWWTLRGYDASKVRLHVPDQAGIGWDLFEQADASRLRIHARQDAPLDYWFELLPRSEGKPGREVRLYESPFVLPGRFPF